MQPEGDAKWILDKWKDEAVRTLQSMTDETPTISWEPADPDDGAQAGEGLLTVETVFSLGPDPLFWIQSPAATSHALGARTLRAVGIEEAGGEETRNTCLEIFQQCQAALTQALSTKVQSAISSQTRESEAPPGNHPIYRVSISYREEAAMPLFVRFAPALAAVLAVAAPPAEKEERVEPAPAASASASDRSKTFEVLLDVSLPVCVSFGHAEMPVKEVLRLTTGSIIELNRTISEPVEVIINDCVIARGEVVVVEGNYGVRISYIMSRTERLRTASQAV
jgi:flagellar motor switch protein FliN/FliY